MDISLSADGLNSVSDVISTIGNQLDSVQSSFADACLAVLGVTVAIRIFMAWLQSGDGTGADFVYEASYSVFLGLFMQFLISNASEISSYAWQLAAAVGSVMNAGQASGDGVSAVGSLFQNIWESTLATLQAVWKLIFSGAGTGKDGATACSGSIADVIGCHVANAVGALAGDFFSSGMIILTVCLLFVYVGMMIYQLFNGLWTLVAPLIFFPVCCAFYPINDGWFKNAVGKIAGGVAKLGMINFCVGCVAQVSNALTSNFSSGSYNFFKISSANSSLVGVAIATALNSLAGKIICIDVLLVFIIVIALSTSTAMKEAADIFGRVDGFAGVHLGRSSGGGGGSSSSGSSQNGGESATTSPSPAPSSSSGPSGAQAGASLEGAGMQAAEVGAEAAADAGTGGGAEIAVAGAKAASAAAQSAGNGAAAGEGGGGSGDAAGGGEGSGGESGGGSGDAAGGGEGSGGEGGGGSGDAAGGGEGSGGWRSKASSAAGQAATKAGNAAVQAAKFAPQVAMLGAKGSGKVARFMVNNMR